MLRKMENFQTFCFYWIFGCILTYSEILNKYKKLPLAFNIQLGLICMFVDIMSTKYIFNHSEYVHIKFPPRVKMTRKSFNSTKLLRGSTTHDSFFSRSANIYNYLYRHSIIELNDTKIRSKRKKILLTKPLDIHNICTYFICCSCSKCERTLGLF